MEARETPIIAPHPMERAPPQLRNCSEGAIMATEARDAMVTPVAREAYPIARVEDI